MSCTWHALTQPVAQNAAKATKNFHSFAMSDEARHVHKISAVTPKASNLKAIAAGVERWTLNVITQPAINEACEAPKAEDWRTTKGLGLYVLSKILLSIQATSAKVLGKCSHTLQRFATTQHETSVFREAWSQHICHDPFQKFGYSFGSTFANGLQQTCQSLGYKVCCCC